MIPLKNRPIIIWKKFSQRIVLSFVIICSLFLLIGVFTSAKGTNQHSSLLFATWTSQIDKEIFTILLEMEQRGMSLVDHIQTIEVNWLEVLFQLLTNVQLNDLKTLLYKEFPGFSTFEQRVIISGIGMGEPLPLGHESGPPLEDVLEEKEAIDTDEDIHLEQPANMTNDHVVFIYNSHNRESFLPHLPSETNPNRAYHKTVNITKVSDRFARSLEHHGIQAFVDKTDIMSILHEKDWNYSDSYAASRPIVEEVLKQNKHVRYVFDLHRDSLPKEQTTAIVNGQEVAQILFIIGGENNRYEKNLAIASQIHYIIEENYPGVSKGVITKSGPKVDGVYNQDLLDNSLLVEIGGYENHLDELYRAADILAEAFSTYFWEAEKVSKEE